MKATLERLAPWVALTAVAAFAFGSLGLVAGAVLTALTEALQYAREARAIDGANRIAEARITADTKAVHERMGEIEKLLKEALTPERMELARNMMQAKMAGVLGKR